MATRKILLIPIAVIILGAVIGIVLSVGQQQGWDGECSPAIQEALEQYSLTVEEALEQRHLAANLVDRENDFWTKQYGLAIQEALEQSHLAIQEAKTQRHLAIQEAEAQRDSLSFLAGDVNGNGFNARRNSILDKAGARYDLAVDSVWAQYDLAVDEAEARYDLAVDEAMEKYTNYASEITDVNMNPSLVETYEKTMQIAWDIRYLAVEEALERRDSLLSLAGDGDEARGWDAPADELRRLRKVILDAVRETENQYNQAVEEVRLQYQLAVREARFQFELAVKRASEGNNFVQHYEKAYDGMLHNVWADFENAKQMALEQYNLAIKEQCNLPLP